MVRCARLEGHPGPSTRSCACQSARANGHKGKTRGALGSHMRSDHRCSAGGPYQDGSRQPCLCSEGCWYGPCPTCVSRRWRSLPHRGEGERLREQDLTELAAVHRDGRPRIEGTPEALLRRLIPRRGDPARHLACRASLRRTELQHLGPAPQGPTNKDCAEEPPEMLINLAREPG